MIYFFSAVVVTYLFWIILSGHYTVVLMIIGAISSISVVIIASRMAAIDKEGHPIYLLIRAGWYWPWLISRLTEDAVFSSTHEMHFIRPLHIHPPRRAVFSSLLSGRLAWPEEDQPAVQVGFAWCCC